MLSALAAASVSSTTSAMNMVDSGMESSGSSPEMMLSSSQTSPPMSRTHQYRKVMKPLLERKRRARINRCLDELKDLMVTALQAEGESITKLEKADVLELTVRHLRKLKQQNALGLTPEATYAGRFKAGYAHCAQEVSTFMTSKDVSPAVDRNMSTRLLTHLGGCMRNLESASPSVLTMPSFTAPAPATPTTPQVSSPREDASGALDLSSGTPVLRSRQTSEDSLASTSSSSSGSAPKRQRISLDSDSSWRPW